MDDTPPPPADAGLRLIKALTIGLTATMLAGLVVLIVLFVTRLPDVRQVPLPDALTLPDGTVPTAFTRGPDWLAVVTEDNRILIYDARSLVLRQTIRVAPGG
ncbi:hypothetical protein DXV76_10230 [Rhodobacteraceae bacterium CCMM004]|nr:hypothetical protein DXV76_10230 [Rhodobacteraceae bacterium CCMM004]